MAEDTPTNVADLLRDCVRPEHELGHGVSGKGFSMMHHAGMEHCVLRVGGRSRLDARPASKILDDMLARTTSLQPADQLLRHHNLGQYLLIAHDPDHFHAVKPAISISVRQSGLSIEETLQRYADEYMQSGMPHSQTRARIRLWSEILTKAEEIGVNPFLKLVKLAEAVPNANWALQVNPSNVLYDPATGELGLVDQMNQQHSLDCSATLKSTFAYPAKHHGEKTDEYAQLIDQYNDLANRMEKLITSAQRQHKRQVVKYGAQMEQWRENPSIETLPKNPIIRLDTTRPYNVSAVRLDSPPRVLVERINKLYRQMELPART